MVEPLKELARHIVDRAQRRGATAADVFVREDETFEVVVRRGDVERLKEAVSRNLRLRVFLGNRTAASQTSDLSPHRVDALVDETIEMARLTSEDESSGLPDPSLFPAEIPDLRLADPAWNDLTPEDRIELARRAEAAAFQTNSLITNSKGATFQSERSRTALANTFGFTGAYEGTVGYLATIPIAETGGAMQQDHWLSITRHRDELDSPEDLGRSAAERVLRRVGARKVRTCQVPVVFDPMASRTLMKHVFDGVSGDAIYRKRSFLVDRTGEMVASEKVTIMDDARMPGGLGSSPFDDEGVGTQSTVVIENGVLKNYLHSAYTGRRLGVSPTGNGSRAATGRIGVGPTNFYLKPGTDSPDDIVGNIRSGLYVLELIGQGVNTANGDYSRGVTGLWIEGGRFVYPVHEVTIAGNLRQMLQDIEMIGNDVVFHGPVAAPTVKIRNMTLSGE